MHTVLGCGSVGLVLGAQLARSGVPTLFVTRSEEAAARIAGDGVRITDPATEETWTVRARATPGPDEAIGAGPVFLCVRGPDTEGVARRLAAVAPDAMVVSVQNGVENEALLARHFEHVVGAVWRQTCTRTAANAALATGRTRMAVGRWPEGTAPDVARLGDALRGAGIDLGVSERVQEDLWLKLCVNLMSAPNALVRRPDHTTADFVEVKARLLEEARDVLAAAGIRAASCDGRDRDLDAEILWQRGALERGTSARALPLYNQVWTGLKNSVKQGLERRSPLEAPGYHGRILDLAARHGREAPMNARLLAVLEEVLRSRRGPECVGAAELLEGA